MIKTGRFRECRVCRGMGVIFTRTQYEALKFSAQKLAEYSVEEQDSDFQKDFETFQAIVNDLEKPER